MKKGIITIFILAFIKLIIQKTGNRNYGFHRDELLHLSVSEHLDWGFMEFPPFIGFIGKLSYLFFDYSLWGVRLFPTLAGVVILILCALIANELRGNKYSMLIAGTCILAFLPFYRNHTLFQPVAFDQLFWTLGFYYIIRFINSQNKKYLLLTGITLGLGLMNKYTMLVWATGIFIGILFYEKGKLLRCKWTYISALIAALIVLPNIMWQIQHHMPIIDHISELNKSQLDQLSTWDFIVEQLDFPFTLAVSLLGILFLFGEKDYRAIGISAVSIFLLMWIFKAKAYYIFALYPLLFAAGSVQITRWLDGRRAAWHYAIAAALFLPILPFIPLVTPVLPVEKHVEYFDIEQQPGGRFNLTSDYADMFGWEEQVMLVDSLYRSLNEEERTNCVIWAENYGEAGALKILGKKYRLPNPISRHGTFWTWGHRSEDARVWISIGNEAPSVEHVFEEVTLIKKIYHPYAIDEENGIPLYLCRKPKVDIAQWWADYEPHIFD